MAEHPDDLNRWLAELAGGEPAGGQRSELQTLRRIIMVEAANANVGGDVDAERQALERLMFRLRRERLLPRWRLPVWSYAVAATLAVVTIGSFMLRQPEMTPPELVAYGEPPTWRGAVTQFEIQVAKPRERAERFSGKLRAADQSAQIYVLGPVYIVEAELVAPLSPAVVLLYKEIGLTVHPGRVRVSFKP